LFFRKDLAATVALHGTEGDFADVFFQAFDSLDRQTGSRNFVSLVDLRTAIPGERDAFDRELQRLRRDGLVSLSAAEGRHGISDDERAAAIYEEGSCLLFVSRKQPPQASWIEVP
jgi:hypothetical protein